MRKTLSSFMMLAITVSLLFSGCSKSPKMEEGKGQTPAQETKQAVTGESTQTPASEPAKTSDATSPGTSAQQTEASTENPVLQIDLEKIKPNEAGKIMVVMFHNFVETYKSGDKAYTTTFGDFRKLLEELYNGGYRLISMSDYLNNNIQVPAGCIPMVFTFDDGTAGQFHLVEEGGKLTVNGQTAVGIMEEFNKTHPDFGMKGTFYVNLGVGTFQGKGTVAERLQYLIDKGFEIGNHTFSHVNLKKITSADKIQEEIGGNQKKMEELIPGYKMITFSLPFGLPSKDLQSYVAKGEYQGVKYDHAAIMEVGWDPAPSPVSKKFNPLSTHRVRSSGIVPVEADLAWWLKKLSRAEQYVSDGDPNTVTVPKAKEESVDQGKLSGKRLSVY